MDIKEKRPKMLAAKNKSIIITPEIQLEIFETVFLHMIEYPSTRWSMKRLIEARDKLDFAQVDLMLKQVEFEIQERGGGV
jgi:hypothetical protein